MKFNSNKLLALTVAATPLASAHYTFSQLVVDDKLEILENDFRYNKGASTGANTQVYAVKAGDKVALKQAYGGTGMQHPGPTQVYTSLAPSEDLASYDGSGSWFKVFEGPAAERRLVHVELEGGGGSPVPSPTVAIPGVYSPDDAAVNFSVGGSRTTYPDIPGPALVSSGQTRRSTTSEGNFSKRGEAPAVIFGGSVVAKAKAIVGA
ncbi:hypothetical protein GTA08_BOTSDO04617 [Botryosphaeria dothidea]|uniref:AA9 family lytic polysaccharide monooxygenase n=1 Tax=Botryosphaeria dothidea TaxID=55169 RepID=A0A8H4N2E5_9PEZI|nr:hypothetical protein GTA08_BOTSDO04617 [Botryosphaeria dothidea]